ncbi:unnamed protein product [Rotaria sp. Silwood2]|nr:unnamed protein product [Rotaria sp. Silwood2]CAF3440384.1 unnamed protein product [Rotaria sp. Silwood2]CAF4320589.1 unnamed protein product [Rotaria sp. Silwood2]CAF4563843.1 unnamed protein product [Rotaria sp. Silwood2]
MITITLLIRRNLATKRDIRKQQINSSIPTTQQSTNTHLQSIRNQNALAMLIMQVIVYGIVKAPQFICTLYAAITSHDPNKSPDRLAIEKFTFFFL